MANVRLERGDEGEWVTYLQQVFESKGIDPGRVDGVFGAVLDSAVRSYQQDNQLTADGVVGESTWDKLTNVTVESLKVDWSELPWLAALAQYEATEDGMRQFLLDRGIDVKILTGQA
ncbi:peptidoglycan-binding domain-containing protein [Actinophytocola glycyrrhizae]|uniref:Peptidoglycan-binding protein n=1 Tax=Actinophytocola glycyrrhizae TaxID=2044873 RepID=A0ABV9RV99_9PSEU